MENKEKSKDYSFKLGNTIVEVKSISLEDVIKDVKKHKPRQFDKNFKKFLKTVK